VCGKVSSLIITVTNHYCH